MKDRVPAYIQTLFEQRMHGQGFTMTELAVFAATLLDLIHKENIQDLDAVYGEHKYSPSDLLQPYARQKVEHSYTLLYFHGMSGSSQDESYLSFFEMEESLRDEFISWPDVAMWARDVGETVRMTQVRSNAFAHPGTYDKIEEFAHELAHSFGAFQDLECKLMKERLLEVEYQGTGRVRLAEFYSGANDSSWHFAESIDYLDALGALDKSDPSHFRVIIPNLIRSRTHCVTPSDFYSVCCLDECEGLMSSLERAIQGPRAPPSHIAEIVSALPSDTVDSPRNLSLPQLNRLEEIASRHGGQVPLHGRLFAQWMHHAYPRECPYPHIAGTTNPLSPDEWIAKVGTTEASEEEMSRIAAGRASSEELAAAMTPEAKAQALPWNSVEELVAHHLHSEQPQQGHSFLRMCALVTFAVSALQALRTSFPPDAHSGGAGKLEIHMV